MSEVYNASSFGSLALKLAELWPVRRGDLAKSQLSYGEAAWEPASRVAGWVAGRPVS